LNIFFTSDSHYGHRNIIKYANRPFTSLADMNETMIANWNNVVQKNDHVYHLGDFVFGSKKYSKSVVDRLNGKIHVVLGNHDKSINNDVCRGRFEWVKEAHWLKLDKERRFYLHHYACRTWRESIHGSYHLYGHSHGKMPPFGKSCDVGVDCWDFHPVHVDDIIKFLDNKEIVK